MLDIASIAGSAVQILTGYLQQAGGKAAEALGEAAAKSLYEKLKSRLRPKAAEALEDLRQHPSDAAKQAALRENLQQAMAADPDLAEWLRERVAQNSHQTGHGNVNVQIVGNGNRVRT